MYDFKYQSNPNTYESYTRNIKKEDSLNKIKNTLFYIVILLLAFIIGLFFLLNYQNHNYPKENNEEVILKKNSKEYINMEISHLQLSKAITQSIVKNLQSQRTLQIINDDELKNIIQKVVNKIEDKPHKTTYSQH